jgi:hypothetical protein
MPQAMISAPPKRSLTTAQRRLRKADPTLATLMDSWAVEIDQTLDAFQVSLDREYDLAAGAEPARPDLDQATADLVLELGRFSLATDPMLRVADGVRKARDEAYMVLGRVEQLIAQRTLDALQVTPQAALPPPPPPPVDSFDDGDTTWGNDEEDIDRLRAIREEAGWRPRRVEAADPNDAPTVPLATKAGRWWTRLRGWGRRQVHAAATSATLTLRGWA